MACSVSSGPLTCASAAGQNRTHGQIPHFSTVGHVSGASPRDTAANAFSRARLRITWDGRKQASVDAPVALFHGAGVLYNRDGREMLVDAFPVKVRYVPNGPVQLTSYFPMPFFKSAKIELVGAAAGAAITAAATPASPWSWTPARRC